jgi:PKD repeat protein
MQARTVTVDGSDSSDSDGTIVDYEWDFGDGSTATGPTPPPHTYTANGNYTVSLTVRDDDGATDSTSQLVTATDGPPVLADDTFTRTVASGWGTTPVGGAWTVSPASAFSVNGSEGVLTSNAGNGRNTYLRGISSTSTDLRVTFGINKVTTGSGLYLSTVGRSIIGAGDYRSVLRFHNDGRLAIRLSRTAANGAETFLVNETVLPGLTYVAGDRVHIRQQVTGTSPTTLRVRVWKAGTPEPSTWNFTATDSTSNLQGAGAVGFVTYLSGSATNAPIVLTADDLVVTQP